ncbi:MAG: ABC transporter ATP-binding protein [Oribacterium sp.]
MNGVEIDSLSFCYRDSKQEILHEIGTSVEAGEFVCILGQSGCGKSTLLRLLAGLEKPTGGSIRIDGEEIRGASLSRGMVFQDYGLFPWMSAGENIVLALRQRFPEMTKAEKKTLALSMLEKVGLQKEIYSKLPKSLSGGMKQRCAIAQAFAIDPPILLMDEPFGALDAVTRAKLQDLVLELWESGERSRKKTVFFVTHDVDEAILLADHIIVLGQRPSRIIYELRIPEEKRAKRETQFVDPEIISMRNELIRQINQDVEQHIGE